MRKDMNKVLTERPRAGGRGKSRKTYDRLIRVKGNDFEYNAEYDSLPDKESMEVRHKVNGDFKTFTDHIGPLRRFLISRVGRRWDDVWSEICQVMSGTGLQANHVKEHVKSYVGGVSHPGYCSSYSEMEERGYGPVYVDGEGILRHSERWHRSDRRRSRKTYSYYRESDSVEYHKLNGCWFRVEIGEIELVKEFKGLFHSFTRKVIEYHVKNKSALSRKSAKKLGLENRTETVAPKVTLEKSNG